jgi:hypothetical protein
LGVFDDLSASDLVFFYGTEPCLTILYKSI